MNEELKKKLLRIIVTFAAVIIAYFLPLTGVLRFVVYVGIYLLIGYDILKEAIEGLMEREPLDECVLMTIATLGAFALAIYERSGEYMEAIAVMLFYQVGEWFQDYAEERSRNSISSLMEIAPDHANVILEDGSVIRSGCADVAVGTLIAIKPGERIPIDGIVEEGASSLNTADLTGESIPRDVGVSDEVISGCINIDGMLKVRTTREYADSTVSRVLELIENAGERKAGSERFISRFARVYTPAVVCAALLMGIGVPLIRIVSGMGAGWEVWIYRALTFLVISCPCALVVSIPLSFFAGIGGAGRKGILVKGSNYMEMLSEAKTIVFDKTGTLTKGEFRVNSIVPSDMSEDKLLELVAMAELYSSHPIAESIKKAYAKDINSDSVIDTKEIAGEGIVAETRFGRVAAGNEKLMARVGAGAVSVNAAGTVLYAALDGVFAGYLVISDVIKEGSKKAISKLKDQGVRETVMLTGDREETALAVGRELGIDRIYSRLLPNEKMEKLEEILSSKKSEKESVAFVGDGINDAPAIMRSDVGMAMGALGSAAAIEAADVVLMNDDPYDIVRAMKISKKCLGIVKQNIWFAITVKLLCLALSAIGIANMWFAIFADVGVMVLAILNAMRCFTVRD